MTRRLGIPAAVLLAAVMVPCIGVAQSLDRSHPAKQFRFIPSVQNDRASFVTGLSSTCDGLVDRLIPNGRVTSAQLIPASGQLPEYCDVFGVVDSAVGFEVQLPTQWNQKLYFGGNGAFAGSIPDTQGLTASGLMRGYATASTDTGHEADPFDASWALNNHPAEIDYGYRAVHETVQTAKFLVRSYYDQSARLSYFDGCSKGGQEGLREAEQYPDDFDGIADGAPALDFTGTFIAANWNMQALHATADSSEIPPEKVPAIGNAVLASCDGVDGLVDGLIDDPRRCSFDPDILRCLGRDSADCLTAPQVGALRKIYAGPTNSSGARLFPGLPPGGETVEWDIWLINTPDAPSLAFALQDQFFRYLAFQVDDPDFDWSTFDFDTDPQRLRFMGATLNATNPDLSGFRRSGGKLLLYHGWSDPIIAATRTVDYYNEVRRKLGRTETRQFARLFMAPGMSHCGGGSGPFAFDYFTALEGWVEHGIAPESMVAYHFDDNGFVDRSRPLCAYPRVARYQGYGSIDAATSFRCVEPEQASD